MTNRQLCEIIRSLCNKEKEHKKFSALIIHLIQLRGNQLLVEMQRIITKIVQWKKGGQEEREKLLCVSIVSLSRMSLSSHPCSSVAESEREI